MPATTRLAAALAAALAIAGCSGGGGGSPAPDTAAPTITAATPADAATGVAANAAPRFTFSEPIDVATVTPATVTFEDAQGAAVTYEKAFDAATNVLTLTPASPGLASYREYTVAFAAGGVKDVAGNALAAQRRFAFRTADTVAPGVPGTPAGPAGWVTASPAAWQWTAASDDDSGSGVASYRLQVATATDGTGTVFSQDVGAVLTRAVAVPDGTLYARVAAVDGGGNVGPWSEWSSAVTVDLTAPALGAGVTDAGAWDGHVDDATVAFAWGAATDGGSGFAGYEVEVALGTTSGAVIATASPTTPAFTFDPSTLADPLADGDVLYARVRAIDVAGNASDWSAWSDGVKLDRAAPGAPGRPAGPGAYARTSQVHFAWTSAADAVSGVASYDVQVASATDGSGETFLDGSAGSALGADVTVADGKHLFARARAVDAAGFVGAWSSWSSEVLVDLVPPTAPGTPVDAGQYTETPARFSWTGASDDNGVASYVLEVRTAPDGGGTAVYPAANVGNVLQADVAAADGQTLYARVRAVDVAGGLGDWSASSDGIVVDRTGPGAPGTPQHAGAYSGASVAFTWTPATATGSPVTKYLLQVAPVADFSSGMVEKDVGTATTGTFDATGLDGDTVYARVLAEDGLGHVGPASGTSAGVKIDLSGPTDPGVPQDAGAAQLEKTVHLSWAASTDAGSGVDHYVVEVDEGGTVTSATVQAPATSFDYVSSTTVEPTVKAQVQAFDGLGNASGWSGWSDGITINVDTLPGTPAAPTHEPTGVYADTASLQFLWAAPSAGASFDQYVLEIGTSPGANDFYSGTIPSTQTSVAIAVTSGTTYYARVAARNSETGDQGAFSPSSDGITIDQTPPSAPGKPSGTYAGGTMTWTWAEATDLESGIFSYAVTTYVNGGFYGSATVPAPTTTYALSVPQSATSVSLEVRAMNGAGTTGDPATSDTTPLDFQAPHVLQLDPWNGATNVATGADVVVRFSEPMDRASVEAAFSLAYAGAPPKNGYVFAWSGDSTEVRIVPDTRDPVGATNVDLLPERAAVVATVAATAKDLFGNAMTSAFTSAFTTADETAPNLLSLSVDGVASPVPAASVQGGFALDLAFDEDMDPTHAGVSFSYGNQRIEARYQSMQIQNVVLGTGTATYVLSGCTDLRVGDRVTVRNIQPAALEVVRAPVTAVYTNGCSFTVASTATGVTYNNGGGWAAIPSGNDFRPQWIGPRTLSVVFPWTSLAPGADAGLEVWDVMDLAGNWPRGIQTSLQVRELPGSDSTGPALVTSLPRQGGSAPGARLAILRFTEPLDRTTLAGVTATCSAGAFDYDLDYQNEEYGPMLFVIPRRAAPAGSTITVHVPGTVKDLAGNAMGSAVDLTYTVSPKVDSGKPELLESLPPSGRPVWDVWDAQVAFVDTLSGALDSIDATSVGPEDVRVEDETGRLLRGWRPDPEPGSAFMRLYQPRGGFSGGSSPKSYTVQLLGVPGATGIADVYGNAMEPQAFEVYLQPSPNRVPTVQDLRDVGVSAATSPAGRSLELDLGLRDPDNQPIDVSVSILAGGLEVPLPSYTATVFPGPNGQRYRMPQDSGGPPFGDSDPALASLPSGLYPVTITLSDGVDTTTYVRKVFLWSPADVPTLAGIDDGGTFRAMDAARPPVVENGAIPTLEWQVVSGADPDFFGVYVAALDGVGDQGGRTDSIVAPPDVTSLAAPSPLATDVYLWTVVQQRFAAGTNDPRTAGWALDFSNLGASLFVVGPSNRALDGDQFGAARIAFQSSGSGTLSGTSDAMGLWTFEAAGAAAPEFVTQAMADQSGTALPDANELFAYGAADGAFTVTESPAGSPLPLPVRGGMGGDGAMFAVAQMNEAIPSLTAGAYRYQTSGFGSALDGDFVFVQLDAISSAGVLDSAGGAVGTATFAPTTCDVSIVFNDGSAAAGTLPYTLTDDGLLALPVGDPGELARGYVGGAPGAEVAALAIDVPPTAGAAGHTSWLLMARAYAWAGDETNQALQGEYRFADLSVETAFGNQGAYGASGTLSFNGAGTVTYTVSSPRGVEVGTGTYAVDATNGRVVVQVPKGDGTTRTIALKVGPGFDTLLGLSTSDPNSAEVLVVTR